MFSEDDLKDLKKYFPGPERSYKDSIEIFLYCCHKSGSTSLLNSLISRKRDVIRLHNNHSFKWKMRQGGYKKELAYTINDIINYCSLKNQVFVIDVYRDPLEKNISTIFEKYKKEIALLKYDQMLDFLDEKFLLELERSSFEEWPIDVFSYPFDKEKGYQVIVKNNITYILLKFDRIPEWGTQLGHILNQMDLTLTAHNVTMCKKNIRDNYKYALENWKIPKEYIAYFLNKDRLKALHHFLTETEYTNYYRKVYSNSR